jgi:hypothetical protein
VDDRRLALEEPKMNTEIPLGLVPIYGDSREPELDDAAADECWHRWKPHSPLTNKLFCCVDAMRDTRTALSPLLLAPDEVGNKRRLVPALTAVFKWAKCVRDLHEGIGNQAKGRISKAERQALSKLFRAFEKQVNTNDGPMKTARDKLAAHVDKDVFKDDPRTLWAGFSLPAILCWIRASVEMMAALIEPDVYAWTRGEDGSRFVRVMQFDSREVCLAFEEGKAPTVVSMTLARSPKYGIEREVRQLVAVCRQLQSNLEIATTGRPQ